MVTGLEKIIKSIEADAEKSAEEKIKYAKNMSEGILNEARLEITRRSLEIANKAEKEATNIISRAKAMASNEKKKIVLQAKYRLISEIINETKEKLCDLDDADYFAFILNLIETHLEDRNALLIFSEKDLKRLPQDFEKQIQNIARKYAIDLKISLDKTRAIEGGVIISYGDIEENCSIEALFANNRDVIFDNLSVLLFK